VGVVEVARDAVTGELHALRGPVSTQPIEEVLTA
jgi:hypothetical protein